MSHLVPFITDFFNITLKEKYLGKVNGFLVVLNTMNQIPAEFKSVF